MKSQNRPPRREGHEDSTLTTREHNGSFTLWKSQSGILVSTTQLDERRGPEGIERSSEEGPFHDCPNFPGESAILIETACLRTIQRSRISNRYLGGSVRRSGEIE